MIIRPAKPEELEAVGRLTLDAYLADGHLAPTDDYVDELLAAADRAAGAELVVATGEEGGLLGTVTFVLAGTEWAEVSGPGEAEFRMLAVSPAARGRGVGEALTRWCLDRAREHGCSHMALSTMRGMTAAHRIYERLGFVRAPERDWWPAPHVELIAYTCDLARE